MTSRSTAAVHWHLMFRVNAEVKLRREVKRAAELMRQDLEPADCKRYWKIPELWECATRSSAGPGSEADLVVAALSQANCLARGWYVLGPYFGRDGQFESFSGIFNARPGSGAIISSLAWAQFELMPETGG
jgi:hypothetical protein